MMVPISGTFQEMSAEFPQTKLSAIVKIMIVLGQNCLWNKKSGVFLGLLSVLK